MSGKIPLKRKLEIAFAGLLIDRQAADPTFLPGHAIVCATTGLSPDTPSAPGQTPIEPELPYTSVGCKETRDRPDFPSGYGMKDAVVVIYSKTQATDEIRAAADDREAAVEELFDDPAAIVAALNQPELAITQDTRRQQDLYLYGVEDVETADDHTQTTWEDEIIFRVCCQGCDPDRA